MRWKINSKISLLISNVPTFYFSDDLDLLSLQLFTEMCIYAELPHG